MRSGPGQHKTVAALNFQRKQFAGRAEVVAVYFGEVPQPCWDCRPMFLSLASGGSCDTKSFAEPLKANALERERDARPEIKTLARADASDETERQLRRVALRDARQG
jgi:hypothetical protein